MIPPTDQHERGISPVASQRRIFRSAASRRVALGAVGVGAITLLGFGINAAMHDQGPPQRQTDAATTIAQTVASPPEPKIEPKPVVQETVPAVVNAPPPVVAAAAAPTYVMFPSGGGETSFDVPPPVAREDKPVVAPGATADGAAKTQVAFKPSTLVGGKAGPAIRLTYVMTPQLVPCRLDTAMDSTLAGAIMCRTTTDVLSPDHVLLLPAGTNVVGTYKSDVRQGQNRLFAFSGSAITKEGIPVPLDSGIADSLGRTGINGDVDNHVAERFGAAIALTAAQASFSLAQAMVQRGNQNNFNFGGGGGSGSGIDGVASEILRSQISIPPTISVPPGTVVSIVVDHAIDFSDALHVEARR